MSPGTVQTLEMSEGSQRFQVFITDISDRSGLMMLVAERKAGLVSLSMTQVGILFVLASGSLLFALMHYVNGRDRFEYRRAGAAYRDSQSKVEAALTRGRCGLLDWDIGRGRMFWSPSMYELLGMPARPEVIGFREVSGLVHPEDGSLSDIAEAVLADDTNSIDRVIRMRHQDGAWIWLRMRAELVIQPLSGSPHVVGIAVDVTEQIKLEQQSKTADIRLRDAVNTISEAFVLWDANNKLVVCNNKYQKTSQFDRRCGQASHTLRKSDRGRAAPRHQIARGWRGTVPQWTEFLRGATGRRNLAQNQ